MLSNTKKQYFSKTMIVVSICLIMFSLLTGVYDASKPTSMSVLPNVPKENEPLMINFNLNNPSADATVADYQLYANGELVMQGNTQLAASSSKTYQYTYKNPLKLGEQMNFLLKYTTNGKTSEESIALPAYPPQVWSSFVSFAAMSTTMMSYMTTMTYYNDTFNGISTISVSVIISLILIGLLIFLEMSDDSKHQRLNNLRTRFSRLSGILFVIFMGAIFTQMALIIGKIG